MTKIKYIRKYGLEIPFLKSRPMGVKFPLMDYTTMTPLPEEEQVIEVTPFEAKDLVKQGHFAMVEEPKKTRKKEVEENV
jgi:hypothetical protein